MRDVGLAFVIIGLGIAIIVMAVGLRKWRRSIQRRRRRGNPLRLTLSPHALRDDVVIVSVSNRSDERHVLRWCSLVTSDHGEHLGPDIHETVLGPGDGGIFLLERDAMPASGVRWTKLQVFDERGRHATAAIPRQLSSCLERRAT